MATDPEGLAFRDVAADALARAATGPGEALAAAVDVLDAAAAYKKGLRAELDEELAPFLDEKGRPEEAYRGAIRRIETRFARRERRAERDQVDRILLAASALLRDRIAATVQAPAALRLNLDREAAPAAEVGGLVASLAAVEGARAELADDVNRNARLVVEQAFLVVAGAAAG